MLCCGGPTAGQRKRRDPRPPSPQGKGKEEVNCCLVVIKGHFLPFSFFWSAALHWNHTPERKEEKHGEDKDGPSSSSEVWWLRWQRDNFTLGSLMLRVSFHSRDPFVPLYCTCCMLFMPSFLLATTCSPSPPPFQD